MILRIRSIALVMLLMMLLLGVIRGTEVTGLDGNPVQAGKPVNGIYYGSTMTNDGPRNLLIGGIQQASDNPNDNPDYINLADDFHAIYVPTYYSRSVYGTNENSVGGLEAAFASISNLVTAGATLIYDSDQVNKAAHGEATQWNGLESPVLNNQQYDSIICHSGGTATAVSALKNQNVKCNNLIMVSPMKGTLSDEEYKNNIEQILNSNAVNHIVVIWSPEDTPTGALAFYEAQISSDWNPEKIKVFKVDLPQDSQDGKQAHIDLFFKYTKENIRNFVNIDSKEQTPTAEDWLRKGDALKAAGRTSEADAAYAKANELASLDSLQFTEEALKQAPNDANLWSNKAACLDSLNRFDEALSAVEKAIELNPNNGAAWHNKGQILRHLGRTADAKAASERANELGTP